MRKVEIVGIGTSLPKNVVKGCGTWKKVCKVNTLA